MPPEDYRRHAAECLRILVKTTDVQDRALLIAMAQAFRQLAVQAEKNLDTVLIYETPEPRQHVAQQQQQTQPDDPEKEE
jgi:hypothetical protein